MNWMEQNCCSKCGKPFWAMNDKDPFKIGDMVTPRWRYGYHGRLFKIVFQFKNGDYKLLFLYGKEKGTSLERYAWWELEQRKVVK
jgi:hypothetical protein